jgi:hypothetical protein
MSLPEELAGPAVSAPVVRDHAEAVLGQEMQLAIPGIGVERPTVREGDNRAAAPVLEVDGSSIFGGDEVHAVSLRQ